MADAGTLPKDLISAGDWPDFCDWARDAGYDESYFNRYDSKSYALQQQYLEEVSHES